MTKIEETATPRNELAFMGSRVFRPSHPYISKFLAGKYVVSVTGHRPDKLGGYSSELKALAGREPVKAFSGTFGFLSNFSSCKVKLDGVEYKTVEAAFQAAKTFDARQRKSIARAKTPAEAKKLGRGVTLRPDWEEVKVQVMEQLLRQKFSGLFIQNKLLATQGRDLQENNSHGDTFWGLVDGVGQNTLGLFLMKLRHEFLQARDFIVRDPEEVLNAVVRRHIAALKEQHGEKLVVVTGMALGLDITVARVCKELDVDFVAVLPFLTQYKAWPVESQKVWAGLLRYSAMTICVGSQDLADADVRTAMQWRNEVMVDLAHEVLALWDGSAGGTANCVRDAEEQEKPIKNIHADWHRAYFGIGLQVGKRVETPQGGGKVIDVREGDQVVVALDNNPCKSLVEGILPPPWVFPATQVKFQNQ